jgi:hypothetical protein
LRRDFAGRQQFVRFDIAALVFGESVEKHRALVRPVREKHPMADGTSWPSLATRCLISPPPRSASINPRSARETASLKLASVMCSRRAKRANHLFLKIRMARSLRMLDC